MMTNIRNILLFKALLLSTLVLTTTTLFSEEESEEEKSAFKGDVQLGYLMSSGNSETTTLNSKLNLAYDLKEWLQKLSVEAYSTSDNDVTTGERYNIEYQVDKKFSEGRYIFGNTSYLDDRFSGYDYISTFAAGYGHQFYNKDKTILDAEIGLGYRTSSLTDENVVVGEDQKISEALIRLAVNYHWYIAEGRSLTSKLKIDSGEESVISYFELGFITMISGNLSLKTAFEARHNSEVPEGTENLDTITSLNLLYAF